MRLTALTLLALTRLATAQQAPPPMQNGALPAGSPDGRRIAFLSNRAGTGHDVYVIGADGSGLVRLTTGATQPGTLEWSRDSREIMFELRTQDSTRLFAQDLSQTAPRLVVALAGRGPKLSPDGRSVLYSSGNFRESRLMVASLDGSSARALTDGTTPAFNAAWSPDGRQFAYTTIAMAGDRALTVWVANADGTNARKLIESAAVGGSPQWPAWSADGTRIAVQVGNYNRERPAENTAHIWVFDLATGVGTKLAEHTRPYLDETPSWLGRDLITFQSDRSGRMEVWVMNADGSAARQMTR